MTSAESNSAAPGGKRPGSSKKDDRLLTTRHGSTRQACVDSRTLSTFDGSRPGENPTDPCSKNRDASSTLANRRLSTRVGSTKAVTSTSTAPSAEWNPT